MQPYTDQEKEGKKIRTFSADVENEELIWHRDKTHREVTVVEGTGWFFQLDESVPFELKKGQSLSIPKMEWHRLFKKGDSDLVLEIVESYIPSFKNIVEAPKLSKGYGAGLGDSTKDKRRAQFNKQAKMDDDDPAAYKPAPGDARGKTKPSKYTKAYKDMFGEKVEYYSMPELKKQLKKEYGSEASSLKIVKVKGRGRTQSVSIQTPSGQELDRYNNVPGLGYTLAEDTEDTKGIGTDGLAKNYKKITPGQSVEEKLDPKKDDAGDYIKDFMKSDAPQFKGKSKEKIRQMAVAAYLDDKDALTEKTIKGLEKKADESGVAYDILKKVYDRGMAAWRTGHRPGTTPQQWAFARVNSFLTGGTTQKTTDADLWKKHKGKKESVELEEKEISEAKHMKFNKRTLLRTMKKPEGVIQTSDGGQYTIYRPKQTKQGFNTSDLWQDKSIIALPIPAWPGGEVEINYDDITQYSETYHEESLKPTPALKQKLIKVAGLTSATAEKILALPQPMLTTVINQLLTAEVHHEDTSNNEVDLILERGKTYILKQDRDDYDRGVLVTMNEDGSYEMAYWVGDKYEPYPIEMLVDGKSIKKDGRIAKFNYHPTVPKT